MSIIVIACSKDTSNESVENLSQNFTLTKNERASFNFNTAMLKVADEIKQNPNIKLPLDQETLDHLLKISEYDGTMKAEDVNKILDEVISAQNYGLEKYLDERSKLGEYTKSTILKMVESGYIEDLKEQPEFQRLGFEEQNILLTGNQMVSDLGVKGNSRQMTPVEYGMVGLVAGGGAGWVLCGPPCAIAGGFIGGIGGLIVGIFSNSK